MTFLLNSFYDSTLLVILIFQMLENDHKQPTVTIQSTKMEGIRMITRKNRSISAFIGIPYAEPPIGKLRFSNPVLKELSTQYLLANKEGSKCAQLTVENKVIGDENCLFLNIFTPWRSFESIKPLLPVMVLIHGSAYVTGSSTINVLGPGYLLDKDIVYVSLNYRLNIFGFLSTGDETVLGNFGIKDQLVALQWVRKYIQYFGGDPNQVTLAGYSSGADAINYHLFSNIREGYFHRYIAQSGSPFSVRSFREGKKSAEIAKAVAKLYNCPSNDSQLLVDCLRNIDYKILSNSNSIFPDVAPFLVSTWSPTIEPKVEGAYITENPFVLLKQKKIRDLPWISGVDMNEGLFWTAQLYVKKKLYNRITDDLDGFLHKVINCFTMTNNVSLVASEIKKFYFKNEVSNDKNVVIQQLTKFLGDFFKTYPVIFTSFDYAQMRKSPLYFYLYNYRGLISFTNRRTHDNVNIGISHADELIYLYPQKPVVSVKYDEEVIKRDSIMIDIMVDLWTSFVINGVPTSNKLSQGPDSWKPFMPGSNILEIGNFTHPETNIVNSIFKKRMDFWKRMQPLLINNFS